MRMKSNKAWFLLAALAVGTDSRRRGLRWRRRRRGAPATRAATRRRRAGRRAGDHGQLGRRAAVARPGSRDRHDVGEHPAQHHGSAREARRRPRAGAGPRRELGDQRGRQDGDVQAAPGREVDERRPGHRRRTSSTRGSARSRPSSPRTTRTSSTASWARRSTTAARAALRSPARRQGRREGGRRLHARGGADDAAAVVHPAGRPPLVPRRPPDDRRAVRREVDRGGEHRHERAVQARELGAQLAHRPRQVGRVARRRQRQPRRASTAA